ELRDGYLQTMQELYDPQAYFDRLEHLYLRDHFVFGQTRGKYWRKHPWTRFKAGAADLVKSAYLYWQLMLTVPEANLRREYRRRIARLLKVRREPEVLFIYVIKCAMHYHHYTMARQMRQGRTAVLNSF